MSQRRASSRRPEDSGDGSTLVEIVLAIGIVAFALIAVFGVLGLAAQGTKGADIDARLASLTRRVASSYQSQPFSTLISSGTAISATNWYDYDCTPTTSGTAASTYFQCKVKDCGPILSGTNGRMLQIQISWPSPVSAETNVSVVSILNYR